MVEVFSQEALKKFQIYKKLLNDPNKAQKVW